MWFRFPVLISCLLLALLSCSSDPETDANEGKDDTEDVEEPNRVDQSPEEGARMYSGEEPIYRVEAPHVFSDTNSFDQFQLILNGTTITGGEVTFTIRRGNGDIVHKENFPASDLIDIGFTKGYPTASIRSKEDYVVQRMRKFFVEANFTQPAIRSFDRRDEDLIDQVTWEAIKEDPSAISFYYLLGEGPVKELVWSKKNQEVVYIR